MRSIFPTTRYSTVVPTARSVHLFISANKISEAVHRQEGGKASRPVNNGGCLQCLYTARISPFFDTAAWGQEFDLDSEEDGGKGKRSSPSFRPRRK